VLYVAAFVATCGMDFLYVAYLQAVAAKRGGLAGLFSATWHTASILSVGLVIHDKRYIVPIALGSFLGTYVTVKRGVAKAED
jgi:hypothetical protein